MSRLHHPNADRTINFGAAQAISDGATIEQAMADDKCVRFTYDGKVRVVAAHTIGTSKKDGVLSLRGVQVAGGASRPLPQWTLFRFDKMVDVTVDTTPSAAPFTGYVQGDSGMDSIVTEIAL